MSQEKDKLQKYLEQTENIVFVHGTFPDRRDEIMEDGLLLKAGVPSIVFANKGRTPGYFKPAEQNPGWNIRGRLFKKNAVDHDYNGSYSENFVFEVPAEISQIFKDNEFPQDQTLLLELLHKSGANDEMAGIEPWTGIVNGLVGSNRSGTISNQYIRAIVSHDGTVTENTTRFENLTKEQQEAEIARVSENAQAFIEKTNWHSEKHNVHKYESIKEKIVEFIEKARTQLFGIQQEVQQQQSTAVEKEEHDKN